MSPYKNRFEGWYFKHQAGGKSLALIPGRGADGAFVWVITDDGAYHIRYPLYDYHKRHVGPGIFNLKIGGNTFSPSGVTVDIHRPGLTLIGEIAYSNITPIGSDIMGPFKYFPMECRHGIVSMSHLLNGEIILNGEKQSYTHGKGYIESDSGRSFPSEYTWVHCNDFAVADCSIMASVARIPFYGLRFWGCICVVWINGREYRLATYKGVKILRCEPGAMTLKQGKYQLDITAQPREGHQLPAPRNGKMSRFIRENLSCPAQFLFTEGDRCLFDGRSNYASYEYSELIRNQSSLSPKKR